MCQQTVAVMKEYKIRRHYETLHSTQYAHYVGKYFTDLKSKHEKQKVLYNFGKPQTASLTTSYEIAMKLMKNIYGNENNIVMENG